MYKKGQVTVFIVVGIALLFVVGVFFLIQSTQQKDIQQTDFVEQVVPESFQLVQLYVKKCLTDISSEAIKKLGAQGGYIYPERAGAFANSAVPTSGSAVKQFSQSDTVVPYWYYLSSANSCESNCEFDSWMPPLTGDSSTAIETQINQYVIDNMYTCLDNFDSLKEQGYEFVISDSITPSTFIADDDVQIAISYPMNVTLQGESISVDTFVAKLDVPLKRMYNYALIITASQAERHFLETRMFETMSFFMGKDRTDLPPIDFSSYSYASNHFWIKHTVATHIQEILQTYIPLFQIANAQNTQRIVVDGDSTGRKALQTLYDNFILPIAPEEAIVSEDISLASFKGDTLDGVKKIDYEQTLLHEDPLYGDISASFSYFNWPIYFNTNHDGELIVPSSFTVDFLPIFGIHQLQTYYDVSFPTIITLHNDEAFSDSGFTFQFALEGNIRDNEPLTAEYVRNTGYLDVEDTETFLCDMNQRNSGEVNFTVVDGKTEESLSDVSLSFICGDEVCSIDVVDGTFEDSLPICGGGYVVLSKVGYPKKSVQLFTSLDVGAELGDIVLEPEREIPVELKVYRITKIVTPGIDDYWQFSQNAESLANTESAIVVFTKQDVAPGEEEFVQVVSMDKGSLEDLSVTLIPGLYEIKGYVLRDELITYPEREVGPAWDKETIPETNVSQHSSAKIEFTESSPLGYFEITKETLDSASELIVYMAGPDLVSAPNKKLEDMEQLDTLNEYFTISANVALVQPTFITN